MDFAIMDDKGIIEDCFKDEEEAINSIEKIREYNTIFGDLKVIKIIGVFN